MVFKKVAGQVMWLIVKEKPSVAMPEDRYQFSKGRIEKGETAEEAARREVGEETGIRVNVLGKVETLKFVYVFKGEKIFKIITYFLMAYVSGEPTPQKGEIEKVMWLPKDEAEKILTISSGKGLLRKAKKMLESQN